MTPQSKTWQLLQVNFTKVEFILVLSSLMELWGLEYSDGFLVECGNETITEKQFNLIFKNMVYEKQNSKRKSLCNKM